MKKKIKAIKSAKEIKGGCWYISVVSWQGGLFLERYVVCGVPYIGKYVPLLRLRIKKQYKDLDPKDAGFFLKSVNIPPNNFNDHKLFKYSSRTKKVLTELVKNQDVEGYLRLIGER